MGAIAAPALPRRGAAVRIAVVGAGVGGLAAAVELAHPATEVTVLERRDTPGGKCARVVRGPFRGTRARRC